MYNKHQNVTTVDFSNVSGGINNSIAPSLIGQNECEDLLNIEFNFNRAQVRGGLSVALRTYIDDIVAIFYIDFTGTYIVVTKHPITNYTVVTPVGTENPASKGWYEKVNGNYVPTTDTVVDGGKTYYQANNDYILQAWEENFIQTPTYVGDLTGKKIPFFCRYDGKCFIASGGKLQYLEPVKPEGGFVGNTIVLPFIKAFGDNDTVWLDPSLIGDDFTTDTVWLREYQLTNALVTVNASPICTQVFERLGRLVVCEEGKDRLHYSAVGNPYDPSKFKVLTPSGTENPSASGWYEMVSEDYVLTTDTTVVSGKTYYAPTNSGWYEDVEDESSYKWIDIGYKADGDIMKVVQLANDLLVFKNGGNVYTLSGEYPNWTVQETAKHTDTQNAYSIENIRGQVAYVSNRGLFAIDPVENYGNVNFTEIGFKFNSGLAYRVQQPVLYNLFRKSELMICPDSLTKPNEFYCYYWATGAATRICFPVELGKVNDMVDTPNGPVLAVGHSLYLWNADSKMDDWLPIESRVKTRAILGADKLLIKEIDAMQTSATPGSECRVRISDPEKAEHEINVGFPTDRRKVIRCNHSTRSVQVVVEAQSQYQLEHLSLKVAGL